MHFDLNIMKIDFKSGLVNFVEKVILSTRGKRAEIFRIIKARWI